jgi:hypothetical protein
MNVPRRVFLVTIALIVVGTVVGILVFSLMEQQARSALPPKHQTVQAIATIYDGAVCLGCDFGVIFLAMFGPAAVAISLVIWGIYEVGRVFLRRHGSLR